MCLHHSKLLFLSWNWISLWEITRNKTTHNHTPTNWKQSKQANKSPNPGPGDLAWKGTWQRKSGCSSSVCLSLCFSKVIWHAQPWYLQNPKATALLALLPRRQTVFSETQKKSFPEPSFSSVLSPFVRSCQRHLVCPHFPLCTLGSARFLLQQLSQSGERSSHWLTQGDLQVYTLQRPWWCNHEGNSDVTNHGHKSGERISKRPEESVHLLGQRPEVHGTLSFPFQS